MAKSRSVRLAGAFLAATLALSACAQGEEGTDTGAGTQDGASEDAKLARACDANLKVQKGFNKIFGMEQLEGPPNPEQIKKIQEGIDKEVLPHVETVEANAPAEIEEELKTAGKSVRQFREDPTKDPLEDERVSEAILAVDGHFFDNCDYEKGEVVAAEYEFSEAPSDIKTGDLAVKLENKGKEFHEFVVLGKKEGVTDSWDDILKLEQAEAQTKTEFVGAAFAAPGKESFGVFSFEKPGDYMAVCFIPRGTTSMEQLGGPGAVGESPAAGATPGATASPSPTGGSTPTGGPSPTATAGEGGGGSGGEGGPPHFTLGMRKELKVT